MDILLVPFLTSTQLEIFRELSYGKSLTRDILVKRLAISSSTIYDNLVKLQIKKLVRRYSKKVNNERGRSPVFWYIPRYVLRVLNKLEDDREPPKEMQGDLDKLFEKQVELFAKTFHVHVSGDLSKLNVDKLLKFAEKCKQGD